MVWEAVFMLLVLKIPLVYLSLVVWWAIRAEPHPEEPAALVRTVSDTPPDGSYSPSRRRLPVRRGPHHRRGPARSPARGRLAAMRAESRR